MQPTAFSPTPTPVSAGYNEWNALLIAVVVLASLLLLSVIVVGYIVQRKKKQEPVLTPYAVSLIKGEVDLLFQENSRNSTPGRTIEIQEEPVIVAVSRSNSISTQYYSISDSSSDLPHPKESLDSQSFKSIQSLSMKSSRSNQSFKSAQSAFQSIPDNHEYESEEEIDIPADVVRPSNIKLKEEDAKSTSSDDTIKHNK
ncbi:hypothetical protein HDV06_003729 [Boothiomyces sp. JEL0866]|nr:hypothetical protein HDV06_003713 [Boothiomyces sp. JEL0866]KAJ3321992.1 hypothetical protein HDV06_003729 [Boothiomyces sp. JEL0866]